MKVPIYVREELADEAEEVLIKKGLYDPPTNE